MLALAVALGCSRGPRYSVERLVVADTPELQRLAGAGVRAEDLSRATAKLLQRLPRFVAPGKGGDVRRLLGQIYVQRAEIRTGAAGVGTALVTIGLELAPATGEAALRETGRASALVGSGPSGPREALDRAIQGALERAVDSVAGQLAAERKATPELVRDVASGDARARDHAMRVLADRGEHSAVPALLARLRDSDPEVSERAVGALAQLRDQRAVPPLIELAHHRDGRYVAHLSRIIGDIGGEDARAWLLTMAYGHPDDGVRQAARSALVDLDARAAQARAERRPR